MDIIKQLTREVRFYENGRVVQTLLPDVTANLNRTRNGLIIEDVRGRSVEIFTAQISETQKLPAASIKFQPNDTAALWDLLFDPASTPFFNELHIQFSGGGGVIPVDETNIKIITTPTYTVLDTDYILWFTSNCTITLPIVIAGRIAYPYRIFSRGTLLTVNPGAGATINGKTFVNIGKWDMLTFRPGTLTEWCLGD